MDKAVNIEIGVRPEEEEHYNEGALVKVPLAKAPHFLVAGMTGSGKSAWVNRLIAQLITNHDDSEVALLLVDPKRVEFSRYKGVPHVINKPIYELGMIRNAFGWVVSEMHTRFTQMEKWKHNDIEDHNEWARAAQVQTWSRIVVVVDELANLILQDKKLEEPIVTLASMGRAAGIHLVLATQRPSADVVTGLIRANIPTRVCLPVITKMDSRIVLDSGGAEQLVQPGDILARLPGIRKLVRLKGSYMNDAELDSAAEYAKVMGSKEVPEWQR